MKRAFLFVLIFVMFMLGQSQVIGTWKTYFPLNQSVGHGNSGSLIYNATLFTLFTYDLSTNEIQRLDKVNGLSDVGIATIAKHPEQDLVIIAYNNSNIDILRNGNAITNMPEIKLETTPGDKKIYHIYFEEDLAYLSTGFGIQVIDLLKNEFAETYKIGSGGDEIKINQVGTDANFVYAATEEGLKKASKSSSNLLDFNNWQTESLRPSLIQPEVSHISILNGKVYSVVRDTLYGLNGSTWSYVWSNTYWQFIDLNEQESKIFATVWRDSSGVIRSTDILEIDESENVISKTSFGSGRPVFASEVNSSTIIISDLFLGLMKVENGVTSRIIVNSPLSESVVDLEIEDETLYLAHGGVTSAYEFSFSRDGFARLKDGWWTQFSELNKPSLKDLFDFVVSKPDPNSDKVYFGSSYGGLIELENEELTIFDQFNSELGGAQGDLARTRISGLDYDSDGNLWIANYLSAEPLVVKRTDDTWESFSAFGGFNKITSITIDQNDQFWMTLRDDGGGLIVYNENDPADPNDNVSRRLLTGEGQGNLPNTSVFSVAIDLDGEVWVGTEDGIGIFFCASSVLTENGCDASQIIVERDGFNALLFETESINAIAVDGANRKWIGTNNGLWLISEDGKEEIFAFTVDNSPLPSNQINDIAINHVSGEVFIGTEQGIVSYISDATTGGTSHGNVLAYPNPVPFDHAGPIAVKGLVQDAYVKVTDIAGGLIDEGPANGGTYIWNGKDYTGRKAAAGVYLVFSSNEDGSEREVAKILVY